MIIVDWLIYLVEWFVNMCIVGLRFW